MHTVNVIPFPKRTDHQEPIRQILVERGIYNRTGDVPEELIDFLIEWWQRIYDTGYLEGKDERDGSAAP